MDDPATSAGQHSWGHELGRQVGERSQDEPALPHPWMGHDQIRLVDRLVPDQEHVCIEGSRSQPNGSDSPCVSFELSAPIQQLARAAGGVHLDHHVQEWALLRTPDGLGLVHRRHRRQLADGAQALDSFPQKLAALAEIGAKTDERSSGRGCGVSHGASGVGGAGTTSADRDPRRRQMVGHRWSELADRYDHLLEPVVASQNRSCHRAGQSLE